jgi:hypothetical protein
MQSPIVVFAMLASGSTCHHLQSLQSPHWSWFIAFTPRRVVSWGCWSVIVFRIPQRIYSLRPEACVLHLYRRPVMRELRLIGRVEETWSLPDSFLLAR